MSIELQHIHKSYNGQKILDDFSLAFPEKGTVCFFGPSGCGKTTLLNCIAGILQIDSGTIHGTENCKISYIFQNDRLLPWISAKENVSVVLNNHDTHIRAEKWLQFVGLDDAMDKRPDELSGGMRQKVSIARALAYEGDILLMDEPFHALDAVAKSKMIELIQTKTADKLKILVTHSMEEAKELADILYTVEGTPLKVVRSEKLR